MPLKVVVAQCLKASKTSVNLTTFLSTPHIPSFNFTQMTTASTDGALTRHNDFYIQGGDVHFIVGVNTNKCRFTLTDLDLDRSIEPASEFTHFS